MKNNQVKVLLFNKGFVDTYKLHDGIYWSKVPSIYSESTTMESLETMFTKFCGENSPVVENLKKCELKTFKLIETNE